MSCERNRRCDGDEVRGSRDFPCRGALRNLERCLRDIEDIDDRDDRRRHCRCCCCCCNHRGGRRGNETTWGRD